MKPNQPTIPQNDLKILIKRYENLIESKKEILKKNPNDIVDGLLSAYEKIVIDLRKLLKNNWQVLYNNTKEIGFRMTI